MSAPPQAVFAVVWALVGPVVIFYALTRARRGKTRLHARLMVVCIVFELAALFSFSLLEERSPKLPELQALWIFKVHLALAVATLVGIAWQVFSRFVFRLRSLHRRTGPWVAWVWCAALWTGIYNFVFLYLLD